MSHPFSTRFTTPGEAPPCRDSRMCTPPSTPNSAQPTSIRSGGKTGRCHGLAAGAPIWAAGAHPSIALAANAPGVMAASARSTTSPRRCSPSASGHGRTGFSPPFGAVWPARHGPWPGKGASTAGRAIASAGGDARPPWRMRCPGSWRGRGKPMPSSPPPATRGTQAGAGRSRGDVSPVAVGRNARPGVAIRTRTGEPLSRGAAARARAACRRPAIAPS